MWGNNFFYNPNFHQTIHSQGQCLWRDFPPFFLCAHFIHLQAKRWGLEVGVGNKALKVTARDRATRFASIPGWMLDQWRDLGTTLMHQSAVESVVEELFGKLESDSWTEPWRLVSPTNLEMHESRRLAVIVCPANGTVLWYSCKEKSEGGSHSPSPWPSERTEEDHFDSQGFLWRIMEVRGGSRVYRVAQASWPSEGMFHLTKNAVLALSIFPMLLVCMCGKGGDGRGRSR